MTETRTPLPDFEGVGVDQSAIRITKAGDGLSAALQFEPVALHLGQRVHFVLAGEVAQINHKPDSKDPDVLIRLHTIEVVEITMVEADAVAAMLEEAAERVRAWKAEHEAAEQARLADEERLALEAEQKEAGILTFDDAAEPSEEELAANAAADAAAVADLEAGRSKRRAKETADASA